MGVVKVDTAFSYALHEARRYCGGLKSAADHDPHMNHGTEEINWPFRLGRFGISSRKNHSTARHRKVSMNRKTVLEDGDIFFDHFVCTKYGVCAWCPS